VEPSFTPVVVDAPVITVYSTPYSTNCERVALAAARKGVGIEWHEVPYDDRRVIEQLSGQSLVPVLVAADVVLPDSRAILAWLEERYPEPRLYPREAARRAEVETFLDWFDYTWKRAPNLLYAEVTKPVPDEARVAELGGRITAALDRFEALLDGRDFLMSDELGIADVAAFPFLKYMTAWDEGDPHLFHELLRDWQRPGRHPRVEAWIERVNAFPRS
jgi:glutathione S-transferase